MFNEALVVVCEGEVLYEHAPGLSAASLPDDRILWDVIWRHREFELCVAHSHPGCGFPLPSRVDVDTFCAMEKALGRGLLWAITSETHWVCVRRSFENGAFEIIRNDPDDVPLWLVRLREISDYRTKG
jgi:hypothetical protein